MQIADGLGAQQLLDAMDGIAYIVGQDGRILAIGSASWNSFAAANDAPGLIADAAIGTSLFDQMHGADVRDACRKLHNAVCEKRHRSISYEYRCDAPDTERRMRMSITPVNDACGVGGALYQSQIVTEAQRLPLGLLSMERRASPALSYRRDELVAMCSFCHDLAWPVGAEDADQTWIRIDEYYRRGGSVDVAVSHGICPACVVRLMAPVS